MSNDPLTLRVVNSTLEGIHASALRDAEYIRDAWIAYVEELRSRSSLHLSAEPARLTDYSARLTRTIARYDGGIEVFRVMEDQ